MPDSCRFRRHFKGIIPSTNKFPTLFHIVQRLLKRRGNTMQVSKRGALLSVAALQRPLYRCRTRRERPRSPSKSWRTTLTAPTATMIATPQDRLRSLTATTAPNGLPAESSSAPASGSTAPPTSAATSTTTTTPSTAIRAQCPPAENSARRNTPPPLPPNSKATKSATARATASKSNRSNKTSQNVQRAGDNSPAFCRLSPPHPTKQLF